MANGSSTVRLRARVREVAVRELVRLRAYLRSRPRALLATVVAVSVGTWTMAGWAAWVTYDVTERLPDRTAIGAIGNMAQATTIFDASDTPVFTIFKEQRIEVPLAAVSPHLVRAVLAIEDQRFYEHRGIDLVRIVAAALANLREGRVVQGGSTITQQLARASLLTREKTLRRKLKEAVLASRLEQAYDKPEILELYLNKVYFGDGLYGVEAAALGFFGKHASEVDVAEAALLAGLIKSPSTYAQTINLDRAIARRNVVLQAMLDTGAIDQATFDRARQAPVVLRNALQAIDRFGLSFKEQVRRELVERFGWDRVYQGGLRVYSTIDPKMQKAAEELIEQHLRRIESRRGYPHRPRAAGAAAPDADGNEGPDYLQGALVALDPQTGHVRALVGGRHFGESHFNRAIQARRQAGSAFKPFVYAAALEAGYTPATVLDNLDDPVLTPQGAWVPEDEHSESVSMTVRTALRTSSNRAAVRMLRTVGIERAVEYAERLNVGTPPSVPSLVLGSGEVTLAGMTTAFAAFANGGLVRPPMVVRRVEDADGQVLFEAPRTETRAISEATAFLMANMLADVINAGTGHRARRDGFVLPAAGKTGTTNDFMDAWFIGFTPKLAAGVWIGFDQPKTIVRNGYASDLAVPVWAAFMKVATRGHRPVWLSRPSGVTAAEVCRLSGRLPSDGCYEAQVVSETGAVETRSLVYLEYFARGTEPREYCELHRSRSFFERIAGLFGNAGNEPPVRGSDLGLPPPPPEPAPVPAAEEVKPAEPAPADVQQPDPPKRRGFWSRIFGLGRSDKNDKKKENEKRPPR